ncbi:Flp pilus assembly protein TadB [Microbacterium testaceum]|uniref:hypothetical protein n=1 Tax=Microbacterium TaxID=33882 RepID=UPI00203A41E5|nr:MULTISPECIES: hypothetical protein [Microbacterium]MCM3501491.1 hypothetical protein [Microbacterium sp. P26]MDQ1172834.1 Flp pilus assembly protein TadB [Microbacterium testaceum]
MRLHRLRRVLTWLLSFAALLVILAVLRGAGVPLSLPGVLIVIAALVLARVVIGRARRRRRDRAITPRRSR